MTQAYAEKKKIATTGSGRGHLSLESRVKFPYIHESRNYLQPLLVSMNV